jgi:hypothetical protein
MVRLAAGWRPAITRATLGCRVRGFVLPGLLLAAACWPHVGAELAGLGEWLDGLGEGAWRGALEGAGYATVEHLAASGLTEAELAQLGLPLKARRRISKVPAPRGEAPRGRHCGKGSPWKLPRPPSRPTRVGQH